MSVVLPIMTQSISLRTYEQTNKLIHLKPFGKDGDGAFKPGSISSHRLDSRHAKHLKLYLRLESGPEGNLYFLSSVLF